jgi:hypothetical protein
LLLRLVLVLIAPAFAVLALAIEPAGAATCADYADQASAQRAGDTRDADGDGIYCESNPCPCATAPADAPTENPKSPRDAPPAEPKPDCLTTGRVQPIGFSRTKYPNIRRHFRDAVARGAPRVLRLRRAGADRRRDRLLAAFPTRPGMDRDEYPPAIGRRTWRASVAHVPSSENRSHGATLGIKLRRFCDGTRFKYVFY